MDYIRLNITGKDGRDLKAIKTENILEGNISKSDRIDVPVTSSNDCNQCQYDSEDSEMDYVKTEDVETIEQFIDGKGVFTVKNEIDSFCGASKHINKDLKGDSYQDDDNSKKSSDKHFVNGKNRVNRVWLKTFMKNLFESNNIDSEEVHLLDQDIYEKEEIEVKSFEMDNVKLNTNKEAAFNIKEIIIENTGVQGRNIFEEQAADNSESLNQCAQYPNDEMSLRTIEVKAEDIDISEQFIDENGIHGSKEFEIKRKIASEDTADFMNGENYRQNDSDSNLSGFDSDQVIVINGIEKVKNHINTVPLNLNKHKCHLCERVFDKELNLKKHINSIHLNLKQVKCNLCDYRGRRSNLKQHIESVHQNIKKYVCHLCEYKFYRKSNLERHINTAHLNLKQHKCELCHYAANQEISLENHMNSVHLNIKKHVCYVCQYAFGNKTQLKQHLGAVHLNVRQYKCNLCDHTAKRRTHLKLHVDSVHLKLKQHKCVLCDYASNQRNELKRHIDTVHLNLNKHKCHLCERVFDRENNLTRHINSRHLNLKAFKCNLCDFCGSQRSNLKQHIEAVHLNVKKYKCEHCEYAVNYTRDLKRHINSVHLKLKQNK